MKGFVKLHRVIASGVLLLAVGVANAGDPIKGRQIYVDSCSGCHGLTGSPTMPDVPFFSRGEGMMKPDNQLLDFIKHGKVVMPAYEGILTDAQILDVIAYIRTLF